MTWYMNFIFRMYYGFNYGPVMNEAAKSLRAPNLCIFWERYTTGGVVKTMREGRVAHERSTFD